MRLLILALGLAVSAHTASPSAPAPVVLQAEAFRHYVEAFNRNDEERYVAAIPNAAAWSFLRENIPLFECPDPPLEATYYFRWWTYRKHLKQTPEGFVVTEFLPPVPWAGKDNTISCAAGHHLYEGRWLASPQYLDDYSRFWFRGGGDPRRYSFWAADAIWARALVTGDTGLPRELLPDLVRNYEAWEASHRDPNGLYWQVDGADGMEESISGALQANHEGYRATLNSYQYGDARAIAQIAALTGADALARQFEAKATTLKHLVEATLWDPAAHFFKVLPRTHHSRLSDARELHGYTPWYFNLPDPDKAVAWKQLLDPHGFLASFGPTTAEQRHPRFAVAYQGHECQWNGPSWPYATAVTLTGMANLLNNYRQHVVTRNDYFDLLQTYTTSQRLTRPDGRVVPWIDEDLNPFTGDWIARTLLIRRGSQIPERGKDYNHSTYCDLIISGLLGLRPRADNVVEINPLVPPAWDYFCLDHVRYHGHWLTLLWDRSGTRYGKGRGLRLFADGKLLAAANRIRRVTATLPGRDQRAPRL